MGCLTVLLHVFFGLCDQWIVARSTHRLGSFKDDWAAVNNF